MSGKYRSASRAAASILSIGLLAVTMAIAVPAGAAPKGTEWLPGVRDATFTMSPRKLQRYCEERWRGRFWHVGEWYGCDEIRVIPFRQVPGQPRVGCRTMTHRCVLSIRSPAIGGNGGGGGRAPGTQQY